MKILYFIIILWVCFCIVYYKIYRREQFIIQVKVVSDIGDLKQNIVYLIQDEELFSSDTEYFYNDSRCKNRDKKNT